MVDKSTSYLLDNAESLQKEKVRLVKQAELFFEIEQRVLFEKMSNIKNSTILDLGSGPGIYLNLFGKKYGSNKLFGYERNNNLIKECEEKFPHISCQEGDLLDREKLQAYVMALNPDVIILRFVLHHLTKSGRRELLSSVETVMSHGQQLFIIEIDDSQIKSTEKNDTLDYIIKRTIGIQAERGGDRLVGGKLAEELEEVGFSVGCDETVWLELSDAGSDMIVETLGPIWKSFSPSESDSQRQELLKRLNSVNDWLRMMGKNRDFNFSFPIRIFACGKKESSN